ncbi:MAG: glycosyltransferase family 2 protein [Gammaproteobacteria bacterium]
MAILFWVALAAIGYVYVGYPLLLMLVRAAGGRRVVRTGEHRPPVTLVISAYNEAGVIARKLSNSLALEYPRGQLEIMVVSDASTDGTDDFVVQAASRHVRLLRMPERGGKTVGINAALREARGEIIVFSDANAMYRPDAIAQLVRNFADCAVGAVVGESSYVDADAGADKEETLYWRYEVAIKSLESAIGSVVGGDGAIYAIRKQLYRDMAPDALSDFVNPLQIVQSGYRCVYEPLARSVESATGDFTKEYRRKVRIVNRGWRALISMKALLNPFRFGFFSVQIASHKLLRWLTPIFLVAFFCANLLLVGRGAIYDVAFTLQLGLYALAYAGYVLRRRARLPRLVAFPFYFVMVNAASARGIIGAFLGETYTTWATVRVR